MKQINEDIEIHIFLSSCEICKTYLKKNDKKIYRYYNASNAVFK